MDVVILLHGIGRTKRIMWGLESSLSAAGYAVYNETYPSTQFPIEILVDKLKARIAAWCFDSNTVIHFVGHSMGAILIRQFIQQYPPKSLGRVVMLAPPNQGSSLVDFLKRSFLYRYFYRWYYGPAGQQLGVDLAGISRYLPTINYELGILAGNRSMGFFSRFVLSGQNDGKLLVTETKLDGMKAHVLIPAQHSEMPQHPQAIRQVIYFLKQGVFLDAGVV